MSDVPADAVVLEGTHGVARVHPIGATVLSWVPAGREEVLWVAPGARFEEGRAIRGGIPLCWPWFADAGSPAHGLVRKRRWAIANEETVDGVAAAEWVVEHDDGDWVFTLRYRVEVGEALTLTLTHEDRSGRARTVGGCLHSYFRLDPTRSKVHGLEAMGHDKLTQQDIAVGTPASLQGPLDLVVPHAGLVEVDLADARLVVDGRGHTDVVLWNPGDAEVSDLVPGDSAQFACVETAVVTSPLVVPAGGRTSLGVQLRLEPKG